MSFFSPKTPFYFYYIYGYFAYSKTMKEENFQNYFAEISLKEDQD